MAMKPARRRTVPLWGAALLLAALASVVTGQSIPGIQDRIAAGSLEGMRWPNFSDYRVWLQKFYEPQYAPAWLAGPKPTPQALFLIERFRDAGKKGLDPDDYDASRWDERIRALQDASDVAAAASFDVAMSVCAMRYVSDLRIGRIHPRHFAFGLSVDQKKYDLARFLRDRIVGGSNLQETLGAIEPPFAAYRRTEQALARYIELAAKDDGEKLPAVTKPVAPGASWPGVPRQSR
jgi:murein L,D-transpeptidase YcbB/YkuD